MIKDTISLQQGLYSLLERKKQ